MAKRIGITMRVDDAASQNESRDCLASDWWKYMAVLCPGTTWMPLPNLGKDVVDFVQQWQLDGFVFTGGNDIGSCPQRDCTEKTLLDHAMHNTLPVFGVCRGLQLLHHFEGGSLIRCKSKTHLAQSHLVYIRSDILGFESTVEIKVNSFHNWAISESGLAPSLELIAASNDGCVEAVRHRAFPITAVQWHPERKSGDLQAILDRNLIYQTLGLEN